MKKYKSLVILTLLSALLTGCRGSKKYEAAEYCSPLSWKSDEDFRILQLSDIHLSQSDIHEKHFALIDRTVKEAKPNLIVLNGDIFTFADKHVVKKVFSFFNDYGIPWTFTFGNHDDQGYYSDTYIQRLLSSRKFQHCIFKNLEDDDVTGRSNFVINLKDTSNTVLYQVYLLDSHSYNFDTTEYDYVKQDQIEWYERMVNYSKDTLGGGTAVPSSLYMHIGTPECTKAWDEVKDTENVLIGDMQEFSGSPSQDLGFFQKMKELGSTKSIHVAHDHANDSVVRYQGMYICYGVHSTDRIYNDTEGIKLGGQVTSINKTTKKLTFSNIYTNYDNDEIKVVEKGELE